MSNPESINLTALEDRLQNDGDGVVRDEILNKLKVEAQRVKQRLDAGVPAKEFSTLDSMYKALESAARVVVVAWHKHNPVNNF